MLSVTMLKVIMLSAIMVRVIKLSVVYGVCLYAEWYHAGVKMPNVVHYALCRVSFL